MEENEVKANRVTLSHICDLLRNYFNIRIFVCSLDMFKFAVLCGGTPRFRKRN